MTQVTKHFGLVLAAAGAAYVAIWVIAPWHLAPYLSPTLQWAALALAALAIIRAVMVARRQDNEAAADPASGGAHAPMQRLPRGVRPRRLPLEPRSEFGLRKRVPEPGRER